MPKKINALWRSVFKEDPPAYVTPKNGGVRKHLEEQKAKKQAKKKE